MDPGGGSRNIPRVVSPCSVGWDEILLVNPGSLVDMATRESNGSEHATSDEIVEVQASWRESHALARKQLRGLGGPVVRLLAARAEGRGSIPRSQSTFRDYYFVGFSVGRGWFTDIELVMDPI